MSYIEILSAIPFSMLTNFFLFFMLIVALKFNPQKPSIKDMFNWIKLKTYKNPSIHRLISVDGSETEVVYNKVEKTMHRNNCAYMMARNLTTTRNKVPIYTHLEDKAQGVDFFDKKNTNKLDSEIYETSLVAAKASGDFDFFDKLWGYRHVIKFISAIAICSAAAAFFGFQILNEINTIELCKIPGNLI